MIPLCEGCSVPPDGAIWLVHGLIWGPVVLLPLGWVVAIGLLVLLIRRKGK